MLNQKLSLPIFLLIMCSGCGSDEADPQGQSAAGGAGTTTRSEAVLTDSDNDGMVSPAAVAACGEFTVEDAATVLDVPASQVENRSEASSDKLNLCSFQVKESTQGLGFYLTVSNSVGRAVALMEQGRGMAGSARDTIDDVTGTQSNGKPLNEAEGIGEDAYFMEVNGTLNIRVGNVQIQVFPMDEREQMKEVGRIVATGLRKD